ncbi:MAG: chloride channel protein [Oscillospiraceae bacterium]|nr:chloride channel protein [Oscillospiraceae bacterium]
MIKEIIIQKLKSAFNYLTVFLKWGFIAVIIGGVGGVVGALFHASVLHANELFSKYDKLILLLPFGGLLIVAIYKKCKMLGNKGTDSILASIRSDEGVPFCLAPLIFISTVITHLLGGSAGREGAALQLGGSIGSSIGKLFRLDSKDMHMVIMCGMSAVFSALFGTPITAAFFALGVTSVGIMYYSGLVPCLMSSLTAYIITTMIGIKPTHFIILGIPSVSAMNILKTILIAALCAELSIIFCTVMHYTARYLKIWFKNPYLRIFIGGIIIIALTYLLGTRDYNGSGMNIIERAVTLGRANGWDWVLKIVFTAVTIGAGYKGGEIVPTFFIGATFGCFIAGLIGISPGFGAALGMISMFCGVLNCPVASIILSIEIFGAQGFILFAVATGVSYMLSGYYGLYGSQKIVYSKLRDEYINADTK